jgi:chloramphenicol-sensitive protein RarD
MSSEERRGVWFAIGAYTVWGLLPVYWKALHNVPAASILANRIAWSAVFVAVLLTVQRNWGWLGGALRSRRIVATYVIAAVLLSVNWYIYIWAVNAGFLVDSSLGYFITPLVNVVMGVLFFRERLSLGKWTAVGLAAAGVLYITMSYGQLPWIGLSLALTFGCYGLVKKQARLPALEGMALETGTIVLPAVAFLIYQEVAGDGVLGHTDWVTSLLLIGTGVITVIPLLWFAGAARRIPLSTMGVIQYISPTLMFILGIAVFHEPFDVHKLVGFILIWAALAVYWVTSARASKMQQPPAPKVPPQVPPEVPLPTR